MPDVAVVTDTTHYLPAEIVAELGVGEVSLYVNDGERQEREADIVDLTAFYDALRSSASLPTTSQPSIGDFLAVYEPLVARRPRHRLDPHLGRHLGHRRGRPPGGGRARRIRLRASRSIDSKLACGGARHGRPRRRGAGACRRRRRSRRRARPRGGRRHAAVVRGRHPGVPAARRAHRRRAGVAGRRAEDQADPHLRRRDRPDRAGAHLGPGLRPDGRITCARATRTAPTAGSSSTSRRPTCASAWSPAGARSSAANRSSYRRSDPVIGAHAGPGLVGVGGIPLALLNA